MRGGEGRLFFVDFRVNLNFKAKGADNRFFNIPKPSFFLEFKTGSGKI
jgi:hypothetical protein